MRNLAHRVTEGYFPREEFRISARPSLAGSEAPASVEITFIFALRATLRKVKRIVDINISFISRLPVPERIRTASIIENCTYFNVKGSVFNDF